MEQKSGAEPMSSANNTTTTTSSNGSVLPVTSQVQSPVLGSVTQPPGVSAPPLPPLAQSAGVKPVLFGRIIAWLPFTMVALYVAWLIYGMVLGGLWSGLLIIFVIPGLVILVGLFFFASGFRRARSWAWVVAIIIYVITLVFCIYLGVGWIQTENDIREYKNNGPQDYSFLTKEENAQHEQQRQSMIKTAEISIIYGRIYLSVSLIGNIAILVILCTKRTRRFFVKNEPLNQNSIAPT